MKLAFVVGFFDPVKKSLNERYPEGIYRDRLIWMSTGQGAITAFKGRFYDVVKTAEGILVCVGKSENMERAVRGIVAVGEAQYQNTPVQLQTFGNLYDATPVLAALTSFGLETEPSIGSEPIRRKIPDGKILCMSLDGKTSVVTALRRAGFSADGIEALFEEEIRIGARNSNLMHDLKARAKTHSYLLYAWDGLRTMTPDIKNAFRHGCHEARTAAQVVELFRKWITEAEAKEKIFAEGYGKKDSR